MRADSLRNRSIGAVGLAVFLGGCTTYGTGVTPAAQTMKDITGLVAFGASDKPQIDYQARPPIVAPPPGAPLPKPGQSTAASDANWPRDPDVVAAQQRLAADTAKPNPSGLPEDPNFKVAMPTSGISPVEAHGNVDPSAEIFQNQAQRQAQMKLFASAKSGNAAVDANGNPVRTTLVDPPSEYRVPDPNAPDTMDVKPKAKHWWWPF